MGRGCWARPRTQQATRQNERVGGGVRGERDARAGPASAACAAAEKSSAGEAGLSMAPASLTGLALRWVTALNAAGARCGSRIIYP